MYLVIDVLTMLCLKLISKSETMTKLYGIISQMVKLLNSRFLKRYWPTVFMVLLTLTTLITFVTAKYLDNSSAFGQLIITIAFLASVIPLGLLGNVGESLGLVECGGSIVYLCTPTLIGITISLVCNTILVALLNHLFVNYFIRKKGD